MKKNFRLVFGLPRKEGHRTTWLLLFFRISPQNATEGKNEGQYRRQREILTVPNFDEKLITDGGQLLVLFRLLLKVGLQARDFDLRFS